MKTLLRHATSLIKRSGGRIGLLKIPGGTRSFASDPEVDRWHGVPTDIHNTLKLFFTGFFIAAAFLLLFVSQKAQAKNQGRNRNLQIVPKNISLLVGGNQSFSVSGV